MPSPDLLILLKTSPQNIIDRLKKKDDWMLHFYTEDQIKKDSLNFYQGYEKILQKTNVNYLIVDGNQSLDNLKYIIKNYINQLILTLRG